MGDRGPSGRVQRSVLDTYQDGFAKYATRGNLMRLLQRVHRPLYPTDGQDVVEFDLLSLPLYLVGQLGRLLDQHRTS